MIDHETQKELLKETVESSKALEIAIQMEMRGTKSAKDYSEFDASYKLSKYRQQLLTTQSECECSTI